MPCSRAYWPRYHSAAAFDVPYGESGAIPTALTDYIKNRQGYDYNEHGRAGNTHAAFVPDDIVDRFCILGTAEDHIAKLKQLKDIGVDQFAGVLRWPPWERAYHTERLKRGARAVRDAMVETGAG